MSDEGIEQEPRSLTGEVEPSGPGAWVNRKEQAAREGVDDKALYRRVKRSQMHGRRNPVTGAPEVWVPAADSPGSASDLSDEEPKEEPRFLSVPDAPERLARVIEQATAPLVDRIEELIRENERLRLEAEQHSRAQEHGSRWGELWSKLRSLLGYN